MRKIRTTMGVFALTLLLPAFGQAQEAIGLSNDFEGPAVYAGYTHADGAEAYGIEARMNNEMLGSLHASYDLINYDEIDENAHRVEVGTAFQGHIMPSYAAITARMGFDRMSVDDVSMNNISVPVGVSVGKQLDLGAATLTPFINPEIAYSRMSVEGFSDSETNLGLRAGGEFRTDALGGMSFRVNLEDRDLDDFDPAYQVQVGLDF